MSEMMMKAFGKRIEILHKMKAELYAVGTPTYIVDSNGLRAEYPEDFEKIIYSIDKELTRLYKEKNEYENRFLPKPIG